MYYKKINAIFIQYSYCSNAINSVFDLKIFCSDITIFIES